MWLLWIVLIGVVIYFIVDRSRHQKTNNRETPLDILLRRYARGEISKEEYEQMRKDIQR